MCVCVHVLCVLFCKLCVCVWPDEMPLPASLPSARWLVQGGTGYPVPFRLWLCTPVLRHVHWAALGLQAIVLRRTGRIGAASTCACDAQECMCACAQAHDLARVCMCLCMSGLFFSKETFLSFFSRLWTA